MIGAKEVDDAVVVIVDVAVLFDAILVRVNILFQNVEEFVIKHFCDVRWLIVR